MEETEGKSQVSVKKFKHAEPWQEFQDNMNLWQVFQNKTGIFQDLVKTSKVSKMGCYIFFEFL